MFDTELYYSIVLYVYLFVCVASTISSIFTLYIIKRLNKPMNIYRLIIIGITMSQLVFDVDLSLLLSIGQQWYYFINIYSWSCATLWTNVLS